MGSDKDYYRIMSAKGQKGGKGSQSSQPGRKTRSQGAASPGNLGGGRGGVTPTPNTPTASPTSTAVPTAPRANTNSTPPTKGQPLQTQGSVVGEVWPPLSAGARGQFPPPAPISGGVWGGGLNTETTSDSRHVKLLQKQQQVLQEQLEESQRELAKAHAEAAKSAASQQQEPAATAQNMTSTIQTGKKSAKTAPVDGDEDEDSQGKLPDSQPVPRIKYIREVYDEDAKQQLPNDPPKDDGGESSEHNALDLIMKQIMPRQDEEVDSEAVDEAAKEEAIQQKQLKLKNEHEKKKAAQDVLEAVDMRRPLRLSAVGVVQPRSTRDKKFIKLARVNDFEIVYLQNNPKVKGDAKKFPEGKISWKLYERFKKGTTIKGAIELGATMDRINDDYEHGYIRFPGRESREPEHVFLADGEKASVLVCLLGIVYDMGLSNTGEFEYALKGAEEAAKKAEEKLRKNFNEVIATCYDPEMAVKIVEEKKYRDMFAEHHGLRLMCTSSAVNYVDIDSTLSPEPDYKGSLKRKRKC